MNQQNNNSRESFLKDLKECIFIILALLTIICFKEARDWLISNLIEVLWISLLLVTFLVSLVQCFKHYSEWPQTRRSLVFSILITSFVLLFLSLTYFLYPLFWKDLPQRLAGTVGQFRDWLEEHIYPWLPLMVALLAAALAFTVIRTSKVKLSPRNLPRRTLGLLIVLGVVFVISLCIMLPASSYISEPTEVPLLPTNTPVPPTNTPAPPTDTLVPPTNTPVVPDVPILHFTQADHPDPVDAGEMLTYTITVTNTASAKGPAGGLVITDTLPAHTTFLTATQQGFSGPSSRVITWMLADELEPGHSIAVTFTVAISSSLADGTILTNTAWVTSAQGVDDTATEMTIVRKPTPTPTCSPTPIPLVDTPTPTPSLLPAPTLLDPLDMDPENLKLGEGYCPGKDNTFWLRWEWNNRGLQANEFFAVRIWQDEGKCTSGEHSRHWEPDQDLQMFQVKLWEDAEYYKGPGIYCWNVVVLFDTGKLLTDENGKLIVDEDGKPYKKWDPVSFTSEARRFVVRTREECRRN